MFQRILMLKPEVDLNVNFLDLAYQTKTVKESVIPRLQELIERNQFIGGEAVSEFEKQFADYLNVEHCIALNSGTDALRLGLLAGGIHPDQEIITSPLTFIATAEAANQVGIVRFADVDIDTFTLSPESVNFNTTERTRAVIPVHIYGMPADMDAFETIARKENYLLIEDACQAHGSSISGRRTGGFGLGAAFSFYPTKNLSAFGDAGAFTTNDHSMAEKVRLLRNHGQSGAYQHDLEGYNSRMDAFQAIVLSQKLKFLDCWNSERQQIAAAYREGLRELKGLKFQASRSGCEHVYHLFPILFEQRTAIMEFLDSRNVQTRVIYPTPLHLMKAYRHLGYEKGEFPNAERICREVLCLPVFPGMQKAEVDFVIACIHEFMGAGG